MGFLGCSVEWENRRFCFREKPRVLAQKGRSHQSRGKGSVTPGASKSLAPLFTIFFKSSCKGIRENYAFWQFQWSLNCMYAWNCSKIPSQKQTAFWEPCRPEHYNSNHGRVSAQKKNSCWNKGFELCSQHALETLGIQLSESKKCELKSWYINKCQQNPIFRNYTMGASLQTTRRIMLEINLKGLQDIDLQYPE